MVRRVFTALTVLLLLGQGCPTSKPLSPPPTEETVPSATVPQPNASMPTLPTPEAPKPMAAPDAIKARYRPFSQAAYEEALAAKTPIVLFFYASWCPYCRAQDPIFETLFQDYPKNIQAFRVSYNDKETDADEKNLASTFRIATQHTLIFLDATGKETKRVIGQTSESELKLLLGGIAN